jgi:hypothetical protein
MFFGFWSSKMSDVVVRSEMEMNPLFVLRNVVWKVERWDASRPERFYQEYRVVMSLDDGMKEDMCSPYYDRCPQGNECRPLMNRLVSLFMSSGIG